ncbi:MAG: NAD-dependent epimerase/dehydratase family protein [Patescibacteria group bacterium]
MKNKKTVLVTGGAGFIGSHIVDKLIVNKYQVIVVDDLSCGCEKNVNKKAVLHKLKVQDEKLENIFKKNKFDHVFHLAAQKNVRVSVDNPIQDAKDNIIGSLNLLENCRKYKIRKIIFSSTGGAIYGDTNILPTTESHLNAPISPYGVAKLSVEKYLHYYNKVHKIRYVCLRYANVYGPRQDPKGEAGVVAVFISQLLKKYTPVINGNGKQTRDYVFVDDVVQANILAMKEKAQGIYNVGTGIETDVNKLFFEIAKGMNLKIKPKHGPALIGEQMTSCLSNKKIKKELNFKVGTNLTVGIKETINWFNDNFKNN